MIIETQNVIYGVAPLADEVSANDILGETLMNIMGSKEAIWYGVGSSKSLVFPTYSYSVLYY